MTHIREPTHNARFLALIDQFLPQWQFYREQLNQLPVSHADWAYCYNDLETSDPWS
jgi:predicted metal-dependent hydrolase